MGRRWLIVFSFFCALYPCNQAFAQKPKKAEVKPPATQNIFLSYFDDEPEIEDVQKAAIRYAEVEPEKIQLWRKQAALKAWLPDVTFDIDRDTSELWHWESGSTTRSDDDILRKGCDIIDWGVSLRWDLGEIIFNGEQTSIDVRSRLMVKLRDEIISEVTKMYFERIRLKMELDHLAIEDKKRRFEKELRLKEVTAGLDGLTGGCFSRLKKFKVSQRR